MIWFYPKAIYTFEEIILIIAKGVYGIVASMLDCDIVVS